MVFFLFREHFLSKEEADRLKDTLLSTAPWEQRTQKMYDKMVFSLMESC